jgi:Xaa-Pro aminopeptidase
MRLTPATELEDRCSRLQNLMAGQDLDAVIIVQNADLFYFTGTTQSGNLYVPAQGQPIYMARKEFSRVRMESGLREVVPFGSMKDIPDILAIRLSRAETDRDGTGCCAGQFFRALPEGLSKCPIPGRNALDSPGADD